MRIYLDTCAIQRPLDDKSQVRIALEAEAVLAVLGSWEAGAVEVVSSDILLHELCRNPHPQRKAFMAEILARTSFTIGLTIEIERRAIELETRGFKGFDALHLAAAESGGVDRFCTCDDRLLKRCAAQSDLTIPVRSPLELAQEMPI